MEEGSTIKAIQVAVIDATASDCHPIKFLEEVVHELVVGL